MKNTNLNPNPEGHKKESRERKSTETLNLTLAPKWREKRGGGGGERGDLKESLEKTEKIPANPKTSYWLTKKMKKKEKEK